VGAKTKTNQMENNLTVVQLPQEVEQLAQNVSVEKRTEVQSVLNHVFNGVSKMREQLDSVQVADENDKASMKVANTIRLNVRQTRLEAEKTFDAKRAEVQAQMIGFKTEDALWLKAKQTMQILTKEIEEIAKIKETTAERIATERKELETQQRIQLVSMFNPDLHRSEFENMSAEMFKMFLAGLEKTHKDKIEAERIEAKKIEAERKAEAERIEAQRVENERLKKEAEEKEKQLQTERAKAEAERLAIEEKARKEREESERKLKQQQAEAERLQKIKDAENAKLQAELRAKAEAERLAKVEAERIENERIKAEAQAKKAPLKVKLNIWVDSFNIPEFESNPTADEIKSKFEAFKKWAKTQVENI
jgi:hypothetical protein